MSQDPARPTTGYPDDPTGQHADVDRPAGLHASGGAPGGGSPYGVSPGLSLLANHWGLVLTYGILTLGLGIILAVWPGETLKVCVVLLAIQLLLSGVFRIIAAIAATSLEGGVRALVGLSGALAIIVGLLVLRDPLQTLLVIGIILGVWWLVSGLIDIIGAIISPVEGRRGWDISMGLISVLVGGFLLVNPDLSLGVLVIVACTWLIAIGFIAIVSAFRLRADHRSASPATAPAA